jgi:hypothetical protein
MSDPSPWAWRPSDIEAIRNAFGIPVTPASVRAINDEMKSLESNYPDAIPQAKGLLDSIAAIDAQLSGPLTAAAPRLVKEIRKGAAGGAPSEAPISKLDVIEYDTSLLMEETTLEYAADQPSSASMLRAQRGRYVEQLQLILPRLSLWVSRRPSPFSGDLVRG